MELESVLEQAQYLKAELDKLKPLPTNIVGKISQKLHLNWNFHSNHLEGNKLSYGETKALILFGMTAQGKPLQDHLEISGHDEAIKWIEEVIKSEYPLNESFIRQLHEIILKRSYFKKAITPDNQTVQRKIKIGEYKTSPNHVITKTGETFYFATPEETPAKMNDLMSWYAEKKENEHTNGILFAAEFHYKFIRIHPFDDGNGRLARLLMNFILMQMHYPPAIIRTEDKENYYAALQQADAGIYEPFFAYIGQNVIASLELMLRAAAGDNIDDPDDLDKQIALLEQKLTQKGDKIEQVLSEKILEEWSKTVFPRLIEKFIAVNEKFGKFYLERKYEFCYYEPTDYSVFASMQFMSNYNKIDFNKNNYQSLFDTSIWNKLIPLLLKPYLEWSINSKIHLKCNFSEFNRPELNYLDEYSFILTVIFNKNEYILKGEASKKQISKLYHQTIIDEDIDYILKAESAEHLAFIEENL